MAAPAPPLRVAVFWLAVTWIVATPALDHLMGLRWRWVRGWHMYASVGHGVCDVTYYHGDTPIDRNQVLHGGPWWAIDPWRRRVEKAQLGEVGAHLCRELDLTDVRADAWCAGGQRWNQVQDRSENLCKPAPRPRRRR
jgi:hypothetical protein